MQELEQVLNRLFREEPFFAHLSSIIDKRFDKLIPTAGVRIKENSMDIELVINPDFWNSLPPNEQYGLYKHEMLHISYFHIFHFMPDLTVDNIAKDLVVNQHISSKILPKNGVTLEFFEKMGLKLPPDLDYIAYYNLIQNEAEKNKKLQKLIEDARDLKSYCVVPNENEGVKKFTEENLKNNIKQIFENSFDRKKGNLPAHLHTLLDSFDQKVEDKMCWKHKIKCFATSAKNVRLKLSKNKINRRWGFEYPGINIKHKTKILLGFDTSGSVSDEDLASFLQQMHFIYKTGTEITGVECDAHMSEPWIYKGKFKDFVFHGRGGTSFDPILKFFNEGDFHGLIYFTDGYCSTELSSSKKILWVITRSGTLDFSAPGYKIRIS